MALADKRGIIPDKCGKVITLWPEYWTASCRMQPYYLLWEFSPVIALAVWIQFESIYWLDSSINWTKLYEAALNGNTHAHTRQNDTKCREWHPFFKNVILWCVFHTQWISGKQPWWKNHYCQQICTHMHTNTLTCNWLLTGTGPSILIRLLGPETKTHCVLSYVHSRTNTVWAHLIIVGSG